MFSNTNKKEGACYSAVDQAANVSIFGCMALCCHLPPICHHLGKPINTGVLEDWWQSGRKKNKDMGNYCKLSTCET